MLGRCMAMAAVSSALCAFGAAENPLAVGEHGLWRLDLTDGGCLSARDIETNGVAGAAVAKRREGEALVTTWKSSVADVTVRAVTRAGVTDYTGEVTPHGKTALQLHLPATLRFAADSVKRFVYPGRGNSGLGVALNAKWFMPSPPDRPTAWRRVSRGGKGYRRLYGNDVAGVWKASDAVRLEVTDEGRKWFVIVNPYGEQFPAERDRATEALTSIGGYVAHGGIWVETGGASFYFGIGERNGQVHRQGIFGEGAATLGFRVGTDDIDEPAVALKPTARAKTWFSEDLCVRLTKAVSPVNRETVKADISLVEDAVGRCWFGAVRAGGWGTLWRLGGAISEPNAAKAVVTAALLHQWQSPPEPVPPSGLRRVREFENE